MAKKTNGIDRLISQQWPKLKRRAQNENNPEKLIAVLEEIDNLLFNLEMRMAFQAGNGRSRSNDAVGSTPSNREDPRDNSESGSQ